MEWNLTPVPTTTQGGSPPIPLSDESSFLYKGFFHFYGMEVLLSFLFKMVHILLINIIKNICTFLNILVIEGVGKEVQTDISKESKHSVSVRFLFRDSQVL